MKKHPLTTMFLFGVLVGSILGRIWSVVLSPVPAVEAQAIASAFPAVRDANGFRYARALDEISYMTLPDATGVMKRGMWMNPDCGRYMANDSGGPYCLNPTTPCPTECFQR